MSGSFGSNSSFEIPPAKKSRPESGEVGSGRVEGKVGGASVAGGAFSRPSGSVRGDGRIGGALRMSAQSAWTGEVHAQHGIIAGTVTGKLVIADKLEIGATAVIRADVVARSIAVAKGAVIEGQVTITSGEAVVEFEEKRQVMRRTG